MASSSRTLFVEIVGDDRQLSKAFKNSSKNAKEFDRNISHSFRGIIAGSGAFSALGRQVAFASGAFLGAAGFTAVAKDAVSVASNLNEQANKVDVVFGRSGSAVRKWATQTATSIGIANDQALEAAGTFGNLFRTVDLAPEKNAELSRSLVKLAADMASFNNADPADVLLALRSGLIGEAEPLRRFGVLLSETRVQQEAMRETGKKTAAQLTAQEKVLARYNLILRDTKPAQGDFARTQDGLANATRQLHAEIRDTEAAIGNALLPTVRKITIALRDWLGKPENQKRFNEGTEKTVGFFGKLVGATAKVAGGFKDLGDAINAVHLKSMELNRELERTFGFAKEPKTPFIPAGPGFIPGGFGDFFGSPSRGGSSEDVALRGAGSRTGAPGRVGGRLSFQGQLNQLETRLAKALNQAGDVEDRALLVSERHLLHRWIATTKDWQKRRQLYEKLGQVDADIQSIDDKRRQKDQDARDKELEARRKEFDKLHKWQEHIRQLTEQFREKIRRQREALKNAADSVRGEFGALFSGPVLNPSDDATKRILGVRGPSAASLTADIRAQTRQAVGFFNDLARIRQRGGSARTVADLRALGVDSAALVHTIATARGKDFQAFLKATAQRDKVIQQIAHADVHAKTVVIHAGNVRTANTTPAGQRRGRQAGLPNTLAQNLGF